MAMERWIPGRGPVPRRPFRELEDMERRLEDIVGWPSLPAVYGGIPSAEMRWTPAIEVFEKEDKFVVKAELPGMKEEDIDISVTGNMLTIKGERKAEGEIKEEDYYCCERYYGSFSRSIAIPSNVDANEIEACYESGVLEVSFPKAPEIKPKKVIVTVKKKEKGNK